MVWPKVEKIVDLLAQLLFRAVWFWTTTQMGFWKCARQLKVSSFRLPFLLLTQSFARTVKSIFSSANLLQRFFTVVPKWNRLGWRPRVIRIHCGEDVKNCDWDAENCQPCYKAETSWHDQAAFWSWLLLTIQVSVNQLISARLNLSKIFETKTLWKHIKRINQWSPPPHPSILVNWPQ